MNLYSQYKSPFGYQVGDNGIDSYGVDHSGFSARDEIEYQTARDNRENQLMQMYNQQGVTENYPQYSTNFWGDAGNNYGFGSSNIKQNIENVTNRLNNSGLGGGGFSGGVNNSGFNVGANNGQITTNSGYTVNTESLVGKPSSYFQNNTTTGWNNTNGFGRNTNNGFSTNTNNMLNNYGYSSYGLQLQPTTLTTQGTQYAQMVTPNIVTDANNSHPVDYSLYGDGFSKEFIDRMLNDSDYQRALNEYAIPNEKGYINNINDPGGETNMGIAKRYHPNEDIKNLTRERANAILYDEVWNWNGINKLPREIRGFVFDHGVRTSPQNAIETTHRALGINPVGDIIGNTTLGLLQNANYEDFLRKYQELVNEQDRNNKNYRYFGTGWNNRTKGYHVSY